MDQLSRGDVLIASPYLTDPNFRRAVVVLCEHGPEGSLGLVVNRPMEVFLGHVLDPLREGPGGGETVHQGGPVDTGRLLGLRRGRHPDEPSEDVGGDLHLLTDLEHSLELISAGAVPPADYRFYLGYAGWGKGQLVQEVNQSAWIVSPENASADLAFEVPPGDAWSKVLGTLGGQNAWFAQMPVDPELN